jgi:hypothetical protein
MNVFPSRSGPMMLLNDSSVSAETSPLYLDPHPTNDPLIFQMIEADKSLRFLENNRIKSETPDNITMAYQPVSRLVCFFRLYPLHFLEITCTQLFYPSFIRVLSLSTCTMLLASDIPIEWEH